MLVNLAPGLLQDCRNSSYAYNYNYFFEIVSQVKFSKFIIIPFFINVGTVFVVLVREGLDGW